MNTIVMVTIGLIVYLLIGWRLAHRQANAIILKDIIRHTEPMMDAPLIGATYFGWLLFWPFIHIVKLCQRFLPPIGILQSISRFLSKFQVAEKPVTVLAFLVSKLIDGPFETWGERFVMKQRQIHA